MISTHTQTYDCSRVRDQYIRWWRRRWSSLFLLALLVKTSKDLCMLRMVRACCFLGRRHLWWWWDVHTADSQHLSYMKKLCFCLRVRFLSESIVLASCFCSLCVCVCNPDDPEDPLVFLQTFKQQHKLSHTTHKNTRRGDAPTTQHYTQYNNEFVPTKSRLICLLRCCCCCCLFLNPKLIFYGNTRLVLCYYFRNINIINIIISNSLLFLPSSWLCQQQCICIRIMQKTDDTPTKSY